MKFSDPSGWHVLIGDNGAGKSTILKAIALAIIGPNRTPALRLRLNDFIHFDEDEASVEIEVIPHSVDKHSSSSRKKETPHYAGVKITKEGDGNFFVGNISQLKKYKYAKNYIWSNKAGWFSASFGPFRRFTGGNKDWEKLYYANPKVAAHLSVFGEDVALTEALEWFIQLDHRGLRNHSESISILEYIKIFINDGSLLPHDAKITEITSEGVFIKDGNNESVSVTEMSDGYRSVLSMTFEVIRLMVNDLSAEEVFGSLRSGEPQIDVPGIILIDEVDVHLHPTWQTSIGEWFTGHFPKIQFIVTTHSPLVCRACKNGSIWRLSTPGRDGEQGEITGIEKQKLIDGNILDAYGTELFGESPIRSVGSDEKLKRLGELNMQYALGSINEEEKQERLTLKKILSTDDPTGF